MPAFPVTARNGAAPDGITIVMPAYMEERNLAATVMDFLGVAESLGLPHCVIVVNDGSPDSTGSVAEQLASRYPGRVLVVHHAANRGYGAAVATGIRTALERAPHKWVFLTDSDGQFQAAGLPAFLAEAERERADAVVGYRRERADPWYRTINSLLWTAGSRILLGVGVRDVDCAYKLVSRSVLHGLTLKSRAATISPELITRLRLRNARVIERPVEHFPRKYGKQTGARLAVVIRSLIGLLGLWLEIVGRRAPGRLLRRLLHPRDGVLAAVTLVATGASIASYTYFLRRGVTLAYPDAISHLLIGRRVIDSPTAGAAQLGAVWLPLPHLLSLPLIWVNAWYYSGFAGSLISMISYVLAVRYAYLIAKELTGTRLAGVVAAAALGANPNVLYMQSTPMTELLLIACTAATVYYLLRWSRTGRYTDLAATAAASLLATLTRYEGWALCAAVAVTVGYVAWRRAGASVPHGRPLRARLRTAEANVIFYSCLAMSGIAGWLLWNTVIFHDPLYFQTGPYAKPSLWVSRSDQAIGHWGVSVMTYLYAMVDNAGLLLLALGGAGLAYYLARTRLRSGAIAPLVLTVFVPFYVLSLYSGQRPLQVTQISGSLYNVRFGLLMVLPAAIFTAFLLAGLARSRRAWHARAAAAALVTVCVIGSGLILHDGIDTLAEARAFRATATEQADYLAAGWLREHYHGGRVLMQSFGNEAVTFASHIPLSQIVYEGSYRQWLPDLAHPGRHAIRWIYMRATRQDRVYTSLHGLVRRDGYLLRFDHDEQLIYERAARGSAVAHRLSHRRRQGHAPERQRGRR